jgi:uncharacterized protein YgbK (DUF1537 family)
VLIVCGSRHPASRAQARAAAYLDGVEVLLPDEGVTAAPDVVALQLAVRAHDALGARGADLVVLLGGDTADAFLGRRAVSVHGSVGVGMALGTTKVDGRDVAVVTKPGGFGEADDVRQVIEQGR